MLTVLVIFAGLALLSTGVAWLVLKAFKTIDKVVSGGGDR